LEQIAYAFLEFLLLEIRGLPVAANQQIELQRYRAAAMQDRSAGKKDDPTPGMLGSRTGRRPPVKIDWNSAQPRTFHGC
jgi:hypothetical protein